MKYNFYNEQTDTAQELKVKYRVQSGEMTQLEVTDENGADITETLSDDQVNEIEEKCWADAFEGAHDC